MSGRSGFDQSSRTGYWHVYRSETNRQVASKQITKHMVCAHIANIQQQMRTTLQKTNATLKIWTFLRVSTVATPSFCTFIYGLQIIFTTTQFVSEKCVLADGCGLAATEWRKRGSHCLIPRCGDFCRSRSGTELNLTICQNGLCGFVCGLYDYWLSTKNAVLWLVTIFSPNLCT